MNHGVLFKILKWIFALVLGAISLSILYNSTVV